MKFLDKDHLVRARTYSLLPENRFFYFKHFYWALYTSALLFVWSMLMILHAFIPQLVGFSVIVKMLNFIKELKALHPNDPWLSKIHFED